MICRHIQYADLHGCNVLCCRYFLRRVRVRFRVTVCTQPAVGVYWDSTPLTASAEIFKVYIYQFYAIYMWLHFDIYIDVLCVPAYWSRDGTETQRLDSFWVGSLQRWYQSTCWLSDVTLETGNFLGKDLSKNIFSTTHFTSPLLWFHRMFPLTSNS